MNKIRAITKSRTIDISSLFIVLFFTFIGGVVRFYPLIYYQFPLNDGGLFYQMTRDLLDHNFSLPTTISYNGNLIPFGYPPLAFYLMAFIQRYFHIEIITQLRFLPSLFATLTVPAMHFLCKKITGSKVVSALAMFAFALMPGSYSWLIMGGGITRSLGALFAMISVYFVWDMFRAPKISNLLLSIIFCSLTILSHPEIAWFLNITCILIGIWYGINKKGILFAFLVVIGIILLTLPWWIVIVQRFGLSLFVNAFRTGGVFNLSIILFYFSGESFATIIAVVALFGVFAEIARRKFFVFVWLIVIALLSPRGGQMLATIPGAMLFGSGVIWVLLPGFLSIKEKISTEFQTFTEFFQERIIKIAFIVVFVMALFSSMAAPLMSSSPIKALSQDDLQAMDWVSHNTPVDSKFAIITGGDWPTDYVSEWFPALAKRVSTSTVQGSEWLPDYQFKERIKIYERLQICASRNFDCLFAWKEENAISYSYLYLDKYIINHGEIGLSLTTSTAPKDQFELVFENPGVIIYKVIGTP